MSVLSSVLRPVLRPALGSVFDGSVGGRLTPWDGTYVLHALGQSNMMGWGTRTSIQPLIDPTPDGMFEFHAPLGTNLIADPSFSGGVGPWLGLNTTLAASGGVLTGTTTAASFCNVRLPLSGLETGAEYLVGARIRGTVPKPLNLRVDGPQTQQSANMAADPFRISYRWAPAAATSTLYVISVAAQAVGDTMAIEEPFIRKVGAWGSAAPSLVPLCDPMQWPDPSQKTSQGVCPATETARQLLARGADRVIVLPLAVGGTRLVTGPWSVGGERQVYAADKIARSVTAFPNARHVLLWSQGEQDALNGYSGADYAAALTATLESFRDIVGGAQIVIAGMMPEFIANNAGAPAIAQAHQAVAGSIGNANYIASAGGYAQADNVHWTAPGNIIRGADWAAAIN